MADTDMTVMTVATVVITNNNTNPTIVSGALDLTTISPTGITTPQTPYTEWLSDAATVGDGAVAVPLYGKFQYALLPAGKMLTLTVNDPNAIAYYAELTLEGCTVAVTPAPIANKA